MFFRSLPVLLFTTCIILSSGCFQAKGPSDMPTLHPCYITVMMNGSPLDEAIVHCQPQSGGKWYGSGATNDHGKAIIATLTKYPGLSEGEYKVTIIKSIPDPNWVPKQESLPSSISAIDDKFADDATTPLKCTIVPGKNTFSFEVTPRAPKTSPKTN